MNNNQPSFNFKIDKIVIKIINKTQPTEDEVTSGSGNVYNCGGNFRNAEVEALKQIEKKLDQLSKSIESDPWEQN